MTAISLPATAVRNSQWKKLRSSYFGSIPSSILTLASAAFLLILLWWVVDWAFLKGTFSTTATQDECIANGGACWPVIAARWRIILFGIYPYEEQWRSALACAIIVLVIALSCLPRFWGFLKLALIWGLGATSFYILMRGGVFGLVEVQEQQWGGLALTVFLFVATSILGMPMAIALSLMRRSELPVIAKFSGYFIDTVRSLPLLSILFTFAIVLPFVMPDFLVGEKLYRVIWGGAVFFAAYQAEIIRGGMQGVAGGQDEAAKALGIPYWQRMGRIILPQAFRLSLPATINQFVITFMETSLFVVVGFVELISAANAAYQTGEWKFAYVEVYAFVCAIYFTFVFGLSRYGAYLERRMNLGYHKD